jgi:hypothetical protein
MTSEQDQVVDHIRRNSVLIRTLEEKSVDIEDRQSIELHFWAEGKEAATGLANELRNEGLNVRYCGPVRSQHPGVWNVEAVIEASIARVIEVNFIIRMIRVAATHSAEFDGWGVSV